MTGIKVNRQKLNQIILHLEEQMKLYGPASNARAYAHGAVHAYKNILQDLENPSYENPMLVDFVDRFMDEMLTTLAGTVCTPERGYKEDGGLNLLKADVQRLVIRYNKLKNSLLHVRDLKENDRFDAGCKLRKFNDLIDEIFRNQSVTNQKY